MRDLTGQRKEEGEEEGEEGIEVHTHTWRLVLVVHIVLCGHKVEREFLSVWGKKSCWPVVGMVRGGGEERKGKKILGKQTFSCLPYFSQSRCGKAVSRVSHAFKKLPEFSLYIFFAVAEGGTKKKSLTQTEWVMVVGKEHVV